METMTREHVAAELARLAEEAEACRRCPLGEVRTQAVFGVGDPEADVMFVGEAPGFHEDKRGEPFVGAAGQLLTKLIEQELRVSRPEVYIANVLRCRPPGNRDPQAVEVEACQPFLKQEVDLVRPRVLVGLGNFASRMLSGRSQGITKLRGQRFRARHGVLVCTFHPAAALRGGQAANLIVEDFQEIRWILDAEPEPTEVPTEQLGLFEG